MPPGQTEGRVAAAAAAKLLPGGDDFALSVLPLEFHFFLLLSRCVCCLEDYMVTVKCREESVNVIFSLARNFAFIQGVIEDVDNAEALEINLPNIPAASLRRIIVMYLDGFFGKHNCINTVEMTKDNLENLIDDICTAAFLQIPEQDLQKLICRMGRFIRENCLTSGDVIQLLALDENAASQLTGDEMLQASTILANSGVLGPFLSVADLDECCTEHGLLNDICWDLRRQIFENPWQLHPSSHTITVHGTLALVALDRVSNGSPMRRLSEDLLSLLISYTGTITMVPSQHKPKRAPLSGRQTAAYAL